MMIAIYHDGVFAGGFDLADTRVQNADGPPELMAAFDAVEAGVVAVTFNGGAGGVTTFERVGLLVGGPEMGGG